MNGAIAQCLYVLTDDNPPAISEVRASAEYTACLLAIARPQDGENVSAESLAKGKAKEAFDDRETALRVLCSGAFLVSVLACRGVEADTSFVVLR